jgi:cell division protein FtsZ
VQALNSSRAPVKVQIGPNDQGIGLGRTPETGKRAAMEDTEKINELLEARTWSF